MRDRTHAAAAILRSEMYRDAYRDGEARPSVAARVPSQARGRNGASAPGPHAGSRLSPTTALLALLGLLDILQG